MIMRDYEKNLSLRRFLYTRAIASLKYIFQGNLNFDFKDFN